MTKLLAERTVASDARVKRICLRPQRMSQRTSTRTAREKEVEFVRLKRLLAIPAAAALVAGAALLGPAGIASASTAGTAATVATVAAAQQPSVQPAEMSLVFGGYYSDSLECAISGAGHEGLVLSGGVVVDYECFYNGEKGPLGPYELWLFVEPLSCPTATQAVTSRVSPQRPIC
jgi:hypothetical protein